MAYISNNRVKELGLHEAWDLKHPIYNVGDLTTENGTAYICLETHQPVTGNFPKGSPSQLHQDKWEELAGSIHGYIDSASNMFVPDLTTTDFFDYTMTNHAKIQPPLGLEVGKLGTLFLRQDSVGGWNPLWSANYQFPDAPPIIDLTPNALNVFNYKATSTNTILLEFVANTSPTTITTTTIIPIMDFNATDILPGQIEVTFTMQ